jgi:FkbM family methyltransferase
MFRLLIQCLHAFGLAGLIVYIKLKLELTERIRLPGIKSPIVMRPSRTDLVTFKEIFIKREYDLEFNPTLPVKVIVDAGANIGFTSIFFAHKYPDAMIISIEPDQENFEYLRLNTASYPKIIAIKSALWNKKEAISTVDNGYGKRGIMVEKNNGSNPLEATSISDLMEEFSISDIDILKMDIEGSEKEVFSNNYESWLPHTKCIIIELHDRMKKNSSKTVFAALTNYNFSLAIKGENLIFTNEQFTSQ